jgi:hypothetical protein
VVRDPEPAVPLAALRGTTLIRLDDDRDVALPGTVFDAGRRPGATTSPPGAAPGGGDLILTANDRRLRVGSMWVRNRQAWAVEQVRDDGSLGVRLAAGRAHVTLPADYGAQHVALAYARTTHIVQSRTVDTTHTLIDPDAMSRQGLYVGATRGREVN